MSAVTKPEVTDTGEQSKEVRVEEMESKSLTHGERPARAIRQYGQSANDAAELLRDAIANHTPVEALEKLLDLHERIEDRQARQEFNMALAAFKQECPAIRHSREAKIVTGGGGSYSFTYAELDHIARVIDPVLAKHGLSYTWDSKADEKFLTCTCTVRHIAGHSESASFTLPVQSKSGMSEQQKYGSANTFAQRKSLAAVLGLTTTDDDAEADAIDPTPITEDQVTVIADLITETKTDLARVLKFAKADKLSAIRAVDYEAVVKVLEAKKEKKS